VDPKARGKEIDTNKPKAVKKAVKLANDDLDDLYVFEENQWAGWTGHEALAIAIYCALKYDQENKDGLNYLLSHSLNQINQIALKATQQAHIEGGVPQMRIEVEKIEAKTLGAVLYFFEFACALSAYALKVNPFNQPGVEAYKNNMFKLLGKI
jgi:hypothetical protein